MIEGIKQIDSAFIMFMNRYGTAILRVALGTVFLWFGLLKLLGISPVGELIQSTYSFFPEPAFIMLLGAWEVLIGLGLLLNKALRLTLLLLWLQMAGTFFSLVLTPSIFVVHGNPLLLTTFGEFVVKNVVLIASGIVIGGHLNSPRETSGIQQ